MNLKKPNRTLFESLESKNQTAQFFFESLRLSQSVRFGFLDSFLNEQINLYSQSYNKKNG